MTLLTLCRMGDETSSRATCQCELSSHLILSEWRSLVCAVVHTAHFNVRVRHFRDHPVRTVIEIAKRRRPTPESFFRTCSSSAVDEGCSACHLVNSEIQSMRVPLLMETKRSR